MFIGAASDSLLEIAQIDRVAIPLEAPFRLVNCLAVVGSIYNHEDVDVPLAANRLEGAFGGVSHIWILTPSKRILMA